MKPNQYMSNGEIINAVGDLEWLEDGHYYDEDDVRQPCSRYYIGEVDGDSQSVWLNDEFEEVEA